MAIKTCTNPNCKHDYQDKEHGKGKRVVNPTSQDSGVRTVYRCTVCKKETT